MRSAEQVNGLAPPAAAFDPSRDAPLRTLEVPLCHPEDAWVGDGLPSGQRGKRLQAESNAGVDAAAWQGLGWHCCAGDATVPAVCLVRECDRLGASLQRAGPAHRHAPTLRED
jgi:hypothetical protein